MRLHPCYAFSRLFFARNPHKLQWLNSPSIYGPFGVNHFQEAVCLWMTHFKLLACCSGPVHVQNLFVYLPRFGQSVFAPKGVWAMCCVCHASTHYIQVHVIFSSVFHDLAWGHEKCCQAWAEGGLWQIHCKKKETATRWLKLFQTTAKAKQECVSDKYWCILHNWSKMKTLIADVKAWKRGSFGWKEKHMKESY